MFFLPVVFPWEQSPHGFYCMWTHPLQHKVWLENVMVEYFVFVRGVCLCVCLRCYPFVPLRNIFMWSTELCSLLAPKSSGKTLLAGKHRKPSASFHLKSSHEYVDDKVAFLHFALPVLCWWSDSENNPTSTQIFWQRSSVCYCTREIFACLSLAQQHCLVPS